MFSSGRYGRRAFDFAGAIHAAESCDEVRRLTVEELQSYGLPFVMSWSIRSDVGAQMHSIDLSTFPLDYLDYYLGNELQLRDPVKLAMRASLAPLTWREVSASRPWSKAERMLIDERRDFGANDGYTIPIFTGGQLLGVFSACGSDPDLSAGARSALRIVGASAHQALLRLSLKEARHAGSHVALTPREREIVRWVANGKSNEDIGDILGIAAATVKTMLARAGVKLQATGRTMTVVQALRRGEIDL